jgi:hypothetical protein
MENVNRKVMTSTKRNTSKVWRWISDNCYIFVF